MSEKAFTANSAGGRIIVTEYLQVVQACCLDIKIVDLKEYWFLWKFPFEFFDNRSENLALNCLLYKTTCILVFQSYVRDMCMERLDLDLPLSVQPNEGIEEIVSACLHKFPGVEADLARRRVRIFLKNSRKGKRKPSTGQQTLWFTTSCVGLFSWG